MLDASENSPSAPRIYLDANVAVGKPVCRREREIFTVADIREQLDRAGIAAAMVYHTHAKEYDPATGNRLLLEQIAAEARLLPCWVVLPHHGRAFDSPQKLVANMKRCDVVAARIFPQMHLFPLIDQVTGELFAELSNAAIPLLVDREQLTIEALADILRAHPKLNVVLTNVHWRNFRLLIAMMKQHANLHVELSRLQVNRGIATLAAEGLADRLIFGSGLPTHSPGAARSYVEYADVEPSVKDAISHGNLSRLIGLDPPPKPLALPDDPLIRGAGTGRALNDCTIIDVHAHVIHPGGQGTATVAMPAGDADGLADRMDRIGIDHACFSSWMALYGNVAEGNRLALAAAKAHPQRFSVYLVYNPWYEEDLPEILDAAGRHTHVRGFKPYHPTTQYPLDGKAYERFFRYADSRGLACLLHLDEETLDAAEKLFERYPNVRWLVAHCGRSFQWAEKIVPLAKHRPNVFAELTFTTVVLNVIEYLVDELGAERVLFGTDMPMRDPAPQVGWICFSRCSLQQRKMILGGNAARLLQAVRGPQKE